MKRRLIAAAVTLALIPGCGNPDLWARYRAERDFWHARRLVDRLQLRSQGTSDRDYALPEAAFTKIVRRFPPERWARADARGAARDVAVASGRAALAVARLEELRGQGDRALADYARVIQDWRAVPAIALEAAVARASALERLGRAAEATAAWTKLAADFPLVDPERGEAILPVLDAPLRVATARRLSGDRAGADSVLLAAERRFSAELERQRGRRAAPDLWMRLSDARAQRGALDASLDALRGALAEPDARSSAPRLVLALAQRSLEGGRPDSALTYASWAESGFDGRVRAEALMLAGQAWEARGAPDSALAAYERFLDAYSEVPDPAAQVRFRRGMILERAGRWEQAVTEYRVLATSQPTHELGFAALLRIVGHHVGLGHTDLARLEGERALEQVDRLIATQSDESVQMRARRARGELQLALGEAPAAFETFRDLWTRAPRSPVGALAGLRAAGIAASQLGDPARARTLYEQVAAQAANPEAQRAARAALARLRPVKG